MDCVELSIEKLENVSKTLAAKIQKEYNSNFDLVIYIAKGGYLIGKTISEELNLPLLGIYAERSGNQGKEFLSPILTKLPRWMTINLRKIELKSGFHKGAKERHVYFKEDISKYQNCSLSILIVDDSVDTGYSVLSVQRTIYETFSNVKDIKIAALNVWNKSLEVIKTDFSLYQNTILITPMSKDSRDYNIFCKICKDRTI